MLNWNAPTQHVRNDASEGTRYLLYERQENVGQKEDFTRIILLMENETGVQDSGSLSFEFNPSFEKLTVHRVWIHRDGKVLDALNPSKIKIIQPEPNLYDHVFTGRQTALLFVEDLRVGDALEYVYTIRGDNPVLGGHYFSRFLVQTSVPVDKQQFRVLWPFPKALHLRQHLLTSPPRESSWEQGVEYVWEFGPLPAIDSEDYLPARYEPYPYIELSNFENWERVVEWAIPLYSVGSTNMPVELQELILRWQKTASSEEEKARLALRFVQDELRYTGLELGEDSYRPAHPFETFQKRFGDCKGKVSLYCAMLDAMRIKAHPALVNSSVREAIARRLPSPFAFNHVIAKLWLDGKTVWVDPTISRQGGSLWNRHLPSYAKALVIQSGVKSFEDVPPTASDFNRQQVTSTFRLKDYESPADFTVKTIYRGLGADDMRDEIARTDAKDLAEDYLNFYARYYPKIESKEQLEFSDDRLANVLTVTEHYEVPDLWQFDKSEKLWEAEFYAESLQNMLTDPDTRLRKMPLRLSFPFRREQDIVIHLPDSEWNISDTEQSVEHESFSFRYERKLTGALLRCHYECATKTNEIPSEKVANYLAKLKEMEDLLGDTLQRPDNSQKTVVGQINWLMAIVPMFTITVALAGFIWIWLATRAAHDSPPPPPEQRQLAGLGGWLVLVGIGLCISPIVRFVTVAQDWQGYFSIHAWQAVAMPQGSAYHPLYGPLLVFELFANTSLLCLNVFLVFLYFGKRRIFPMTYILLMASNVVFLLLDEIVSNRIPSIAAKSDDASLRTLFRAVFATLLWGSYMLRSKRVKATFVR
jgi:hypothetical protein